VRAAEAEEESALRMHRAEIEGMAASWRLGRRRLEHFDATLLPLAKDRTRAAISSYGAGRGDLRAVLEALRDEVELQRQYVDLEGEVTRAWVFLHLLHSGGTP
jgi:outer membrane protein TolC